MLHYSPIAETANGEPREIFPFLGTSRLAEVIDRHGADLSYMVTPTMELLRARQRPECQCGTLR